MKKVIRTVALKLDVYNVCGLKEENNNPTE